MVASGRGYSTSWRVHLLVAFSVSLVRLFSRLFSVARLLCVGFLIYLTVRGTVAWYILIAIWKIDICLSFQRQISRYIAIFAERNDICAIFVRYLLQNHAIYRKNDICLKLNDKYIPPNGASGCTFVSPDAPLKIDLQCPSAS